MGLFLCPAAVQRLSAQWVRVTSFNGSFYNEVFFATSQLGFISTQTGTIHRTTDGGDSWAPVTLPNASVSSNRDITFPSSTVGFISGEDGIWKTTNGGLTWNNVTPAGAAGISSSSCWFRNTSVGVWGYGSCSDTVVTFWRTTDGGANWTSVTDTVSTPDVAVGGITYQSGTFYVAGGSGKFWSSTNDGSSWNVSNTGSAGWQEDLVERQGQLLIASANGSSCGMTGGGKILRSNDGGSTWTTNTFPSVVTWGVSMYSATNGIAVGDRGAAFRTLDGGLTWGTHDCGLDPLSRLDDVYMIDATNGFAVGDGVYRYRPDTFTVLRDTIDFGDVLVATRSVPIDAEVTSLGTAGTITLRQITGTDSPAFGSSANLTATQSIAGCLKAQTPIYFQPSRSGLHTAKFRVTLLGKSQILEIVLLGNGVRPRLNADAGLQLDSILCPTERLDSLIVRNFGDYPLVIDSIAIANDRGSLEILSPSLPITILPLTYRALDFRVRASGTGRMSGRILLYSNDPDYGDSARTIFWSMERTPSGFESTPDTVYIEARSFGEVSTACLDLKNNSAERVEVTGLRPLVDIPGLDARLPDGPIAASGETLGLCFSASASDTITRYETYIVITEPCTNQRTITICYRADEDVVVVPDSVTVSGECGDTLTTTFQVRNIGPHGVDIDAIRAGSSEESLTVATGRPVPISLDPGDSIGVRVNWSSAESRNGTGYLLIERGLTVDTVFVTAEFIGPRFAVTAPIDTQSICLGDTLRLMTDVMNIGNASGTIEFKRSPTDLVSYSVDHPGLIVEPQSSATAEISLSGLPAGTHLLHLLFDGPCQETDSIVVTVEVIGPSIDVTPQLLDYGLLPVGGPTPTLPLQIRNLTGRPIPLLEVTSDSTLVTTSDDGGDPPFVLDGDSLVINVRPNATAPGEYLDTIWVGAPEECGDPVAVVVKWSIPGEGARLTGQNQVSGNGCDSMPQTEFTLMAPATEPVRISSIFLSDGTNLVIRGGDTLTGYLLQSGFRIGIEVSMIPGAPDQVIDTLTIRLDNGDTLRSPLFFSWLRPDIRWGENGSNREPTVILRTLQDSCSSDTISLTAINRGRISDQIEVLAPGGGYRPTGVTTQVLEPGSSKTLTFISTSPALSDTTRLVLHSIGCGSRDTIVVLRRVLPPVIQPDLALDLGPRCIGETLEIDIEIPIDLTGYTAPENIISSVRSTTRVGGENELPYQLAPDLRSLFVVVSIEPDIDSAFLIIDTDLPCATSDTVLLLISRVDCSLPAVTLSVPQRMGSWGEVHRIPIYLDAAPDALIDSIALVLMVDPLFLDVITLEAGKEWNLVVSDPRSVEGRLTIGATARGTRSAERSVIAYVSGEILRGPVGGTTIQFDTTVSAGSVLPRWVNGSLGLYDFCDANGRLLEATGVVAIKSVGQNPGFLPLQITYEIPFVADHTITLFDQLGREVYRAERSLVPAGERIELVESRSVSAGTYMVVIEAGRQRLVRRVILW